MDLAAEAGHRGVGSMIFTYIAIGICILYCVWHYQTFNVLINYRNAIDQSWSNVEVELKRRLDLIDNLVQVVKGYSQHEAQTLEHVTKARVMQQSTQTAEGANTTEPQIKEMLGKIMAVVEAYPDIKADGQFLNLQHELTNTEDRVAIRRNAYNQTVSRYEIMRSSFPASVVASVHGFSERRFFDAHDEEIHAAPEVAFR